MKKAWLVRSISLLLGMGIGFALVTSARETIPGSEGPRAAGPGGAHAFYASPLAELGDLHDRMVAEGLPLIQVTVESLTSEKGGGVLLSLIVEEVLWKPSAAATPWVVGREVEARSTSMAQVATASLKTQLPFAALAVVSKDGDLLALAPTTNGSTFAEIGEQGPLFLASAARQLYRAGYDPLPRYSSCDPVRPVQYRSEMDALLSYFTILGDSTRSARAKAFASLDATVERLIQDAGTLVDPVTGRHVMPARNDIVRQLRSGVPPHEVIIRPAIPLAVEHPRTWSSERGDVLAFFDHPDGQFLGAMLIGPRFEYSEDGTAVPRFDRVIELAPPTPGASLAVYVRHLGTLFDCAPTTDEQPWMLVPYDDFAGDRRASIDVAGQTYVPVTDL